MTDEGDNILLHLSMVKNPFLIFGKIHIKQVFVFTEVFLHELPVAFPVLLHELAGFLRGEHGLPF